MVLCRLRINKKTILEYRNYNFIDKKEKKMTKKKAKTIMTTEFRRK